MLAEFDYYFYLIFFYKIFPSYSVVEALLELYQYDEICESYGYHAGQSCPVHVEQSVARDRFLSGNPRY